MEMNGTEHWRFSWYQPPEMNILKSESNANLLGLKGIWIRNLASSFSWPLEKQPPQGTVGAGSLPVPYEPRFPALCAVRTSSAPCHLPSLWCHPRCEPWNTNEQTMGWDQDIFHHSCKFKSSATDATKSHEIFTYFADCISNTPVHISCILV